MAALLPRMTSACSYKRVAFVLKNSNTWRFVSRAAGYKHICIASARHPKQLLSRFLKGTLLNRSEEMIGVFSHLKSRSCKRRGCVSGNGVVHSSAIVAPPRTEEPLAVPEKQSVAGQVVLLDVANMRCAGCSGAVQRMLEAQPDVSKASVNLVTNSAAVWLEAGADVKASIRSCVTMVTDKGFPTTIRPTEAVEAAQSAALAAETQHMEMQEARLELYGAWALALLSIGSHLGHHLHHMGMHEYAHSEWMTLVGQPWVGTAIAALAMVGPGRKLISEGFAALKNGNPNMNSLVALGMTASFGLAALAAAVPELNWDAGCAEEPVMLLAFVLLGRNLERQARLRAQSDLQALASLVPEKARLVLEAESKADSEIAAKLLQTTEVPTSILRVGDVVQVLPGERLPVDGKVVTGKSCVDECMLTGESMPVLKVSGSLVTGGTVNCEAPLLIQATAEGATGQLADIKRLVEDAQARQAPVQRFADKVVGPFAGTVMAISAATLAFWSTLGWEWFPEALETAAGDADQAVMLMSLKLAIDVMVVACPCALGLATPTAVLVGTSMGAHCGLLLRGGDVLEEAAGMDTVVLDKTGTLTKGTPRVVRVISGEEVDQSKLMRIAASIESTTRHPIADALLAAASEQELDLWPVSDSYTEPGCGVRGALPDGRIAAVGKLEWVLDQVGTAQSMCSAQQASLKVRVKDLMEGELELASLVWVAVQDEGVIGAMAVADVLREDAIHTVQRLQQQGLRVILMSGDRPQAVRAIAAQVGIASEDAHGGLLPGEKLAGIAALQAEGRSVGMVGDGVNDAPALAAANVGIAVSHKGVQVAAAAEAADVVLQSDRLGQVADTVDLGRATLSKIKQNLIWALVYNVVGLPLAAGVLLPTYGFSLSPSAAGGMMAFSSIAVVSNSVLLRSHHLGRKAR